jgi:putative transposase
VIPISHPPRSPFSPPCATCPLPAASCQLFFIARCQIVPDLRTLARYPYAGHAALCGTRAVPWQETATVLAHFGKSGSKARAAYRAFVAAGIPQGRRQDLQGGGLIRSLGGWQAVAALRQGREAYAADERVLGSSDFVEHLRQAAEALDTRQHPLQSRDPELPALLDRVAAAAQIAPTALAGAGRFRAVTRARDGLAYLWEDVLGRSGHILAQALGIHPVSVYRAARRGRAHRTLWDRLVQEKS